VAENATAREHLLALRSFTIPRRVYTPPEAGVIAICAGEIQRAMAKPPPGAPWRAVPFPDRVISMSEIQKFLNVYLKQFGLVGLFPVKLALPEPGEAPARAEGYAAFFQALGVLVADQNRSLLGTLPPPPRGCGGLR